MVIRWHVSVQLLNNNLRREANRLTDGFVYFQISCDDLLRALVNSYCMNRNCSDDKPNTSCNETNKKTKTLIYCLNDNVRYLIISIELDKCVSFKNMSALWQQLSYHTWLAIWLFIEWLTLFQWNWLSRTFFWPSFCMTPTIYRRCLQNPDLLTYIENVCLQSQM